MLLAQNRLSLYFLVFHAKSGFTNQNRAVLSDKSYLNPFRQDFNHLKIFSKIFFLRSRETVVKFLVFCLISSDESKRAGLFHVWAVYKSLTMLNFSFNLVQLVF